MGVSRSLFWEWLAGSHRVDSIPMAGVDEVGREEVVSCGMQMLVRYAYFGGSQNPHPKDKDTRYDDKRGWVGGGRRDDRNLQILVRQSPPCTILKVKPTPFVPSNIAIKPRMLRRRRAK